MGKIGKALGHKGCLTDRNFCDVWHWNRCCRWNRTRGRAELRKGPAFWCANSPKNAPCSSLPTGIHGSNKKKPAAIRCSSAGRVNVFLGARSRTRIDQGGCLRVMWRSVARSPPSAVPAAEAIWRLGIGRLEKTSQGVTSDWRKHRPRDMAKLITCHSSFNSPTPKPTLRHEEGAR